MASIAEIVGQNIERERKSHALSQAQVAEAIGVKALAVYRWESGKSWPTARNIEALSKLFKVHASTFFLHETAPADAKVRQALITLSRALGYPLRLPRRSRAYE